MVKWLKAIGISFFLVLIGILLNAAIGLTRIFFPPYIDFMIVFIILVITIRVCSK